MLPSRIRSVGTQVILLLIFFLIQNVSLGQSKGDLVKIKKIDSLIRKLIAGEHSPGFALGIQVRDEEPIIKVYGFADLRNHVKVTLSHQFRIASVTKPFTAVAILKLVELGKLSLEDKIDKFFPTYPNGENIAIYHLLSHTSGIPNWWEGQMPANVPGSFPMCDSPHRYLQQMKNHALFLPGKFYKYSNSGYVLLGEILEKVAGQKYEEFLAAHIFKSAGMTSTEMEHINDPSEKWVKGYAIDSSKNSPFIDPLVYPMPFSAGGLRSNASDLLKFFSALKAGKIVSPALFSKMISYALLNSGRPVYEGGYRAPGAKPAGVHADMERRGYGLGFHLMDLYKTPVYYHSGGIAGFNSYLMHIPANNTTIVLLANAEDGIIPALKDIRKIATEIGRE